jgi:hypothetical protein
MQQGVKFSTEVESHRAWRIQPTLARSDNPQADKQATNKTKNSSKRAVLRASKTDRPQTKQK